MQAYCTIITPDFLPFAKTLFHSIRRFHPEADFHVLVVGENTSVNNAGEMKLHFISDLSTQPMVLQVIQQYGYTGDSFRWSMKPVFISYLLQQYRQVLYMDCDIHFFNDPKFLWQELDERSLLLTPHWADADPFKDEDMFLMNFRIGLFNAGFIGATRKGIPALEWWTQACAYAISRETEKGLFVDQRYLDLITVLDEEAKILRHRGCNLGSWNINSCKRSLRDGQVLINNQYPVVFIHFNHETIKHILNGNDSLLRPFYDQYEKEFATQGSSLPQMIPAVEQWKQTNFLVDLKRKTTIRTRFKRWLYRLSRKL